MTKIDECDLAEEAKWDLKRKICSTFVISMDRILECVNYKRSDTQSGWWDNDTEEKVLNFITSVSNFINFKMESNTVYHILFTKVGIISVFFDENCLKMIEFSRFVIQKGSLSKTPRGNCWYNVLPQNLAISLYVVSNKTYMF